MEFYDIAGLVKGAYKGEGLVNQFLSHIREVNAIVQVIRCFPSEEIIHIEQTIDPMRDLEIISTELILKDLETAEKYLANAEKEAKIGKKEAIKEIEILKLAREQLNKGVMLNQLMPEQLENIQHLSFLTNKPQIYILNGSESDVSEELKNKIKSLNAEYLIIDLTDAGVGAINELIKKAYKILRLISFFTTGEDETKAWTIKEGSKAPQAAGEIHSDFEKKFIRAETINWDKLLEAGSWSQSKQKGWLRLEGKDYIVQDGDVMIVRHAQ